MRAPAGAQRSRQTCFPGTIPPAGSPYPMRSSSWRQRRFGSSCERHQACLRLVGRRIPTAVLRGEDLRPADNSEYERSLLIDPQPVPGLPEPVRPPSPGSAMSTVSAWFSNRLSELHGSLTNRVQTALHRPVHRMMRVQNSPLPSLSTSPASCICFTAARRCVTRARPSISPYMSSTASMGRTDRTRKS